MSATVAMLRASLLSLTRDRQTLTETILFPAILVAAFGAFNLDVTHVGFDTTGAAGATVDSTPYLDFVLPGLLALTSVQFAVFWTSVAYARLGETKVLRRLRATPMPFRSFLAAQVMARLLVVAAQATVVTLLARALGAEIAGSTVLVVAVTTAGSAAFLAIGLAVGSMAANAESANALSGLIVLPLVFLSGAFFPLAGLPSWLESVMAVLPIVPLLAALRAVVIDGATLGDIATDLGQVLAWLPPATGLAVLAMRSAGGVPARVRAGVAVGPAPQPAGGVGRIDGVGRTGGFRCRCRPASLIPRSTRRSSLPTAARWPTRSTVTATVVRCSISTATRGLATKRRCCTRLRSASASGSSAPTDRAWADPTSSGDGPCSAGSTTWRNWPTTSALIDSPCSASPAVDPTLPPAPIAYLSG